MNSSRKNFQLFFFIFVFFMAATVSNHAKVPKIPEEVTSCEIQLFHKDVFKAGLKTLMDLEYKIDKKKKNKFIHGFIGTDRLIGFSMNMQPKGTRHIEEVNIWIEPLSKESTNVSIYASKAIYKLEPNQNPKLMESNRREQIEKKVQMALKKNLNIN